VFVLTPFLPLSQVHDDPLSLANVSGRSASLTLLRVKLLSVYFNWLVVRFSFSFLAFFFFLLSFLFRPFC